MYGFSDVTEDIGLLDYVFRKVLSESPSESERV
jgi:hypothetical protein